jgi:oligopeptide transport system substrate-binding protein
VSNLAQTISQSPFTNYHSSMRRILLIPTLFLLAIAVVCFLLSAGPFTRSQAVVRPISIGTVDDIKILDPAKMSWANDIRCAMALFEGLTMYDTRDKLQPIPAAAESWEISPDRKTYTFHLRANGRWSNGDPVTADDFIFAWRRALNPVTGADYIGLLRGIEGAEELTAALEKKQANPPLRGVKKIDDRTLEVRLKDPCTYFLDLVAMPVFFPLAQKSMQPFLLDDGSYNEAFTQPPHLVSNGPFQLAEWRVKRDLNMTPNPFYWDKASVQCPALHFETITDPRAALMKFESGAVDLLTFRPDGFIDAMLEQQRVEHKWPKLHSMPVFGTYYYVVNTTRKPFDDKRVRKALALAIDRQKITGFIRAGEVPLGLIVPPETINGYVSPAGLSYDPEGARGLLAAAGYPNGRGLKAVEILYNSESFHGKVAQAVGQMWQTNLGITVNFKGLERGSFNSARRHDHDFDIARGGWYGDYPDPTTWLDLFRSTDGNNDGKFNSPAYDALMARSDGEVDPAKRFALLKEAENMLVNEELPFIPLYQYADGFLCDGRKLQGVELNSRLMTQLKWIRRAP